jgi:serine/threonine-protein kinase RsbW
MSGRAEPVVLDLPSEAGVLGLVRASLRALVEEGGGLPLASREVDEVLVVLQEACTNAIRHAHKGDATKRLRVELYRGEAALEILVKDRGEPFTLPVGDSPDPESLIEGGYGIGIMRAWMDEVSVSHQDGGNVLRLVRRYRVESAVR